MVLGFGLVVFLVAVDLGKVPGVAEWHVEYELMRIAQTVAEVISWAVLTVGEPGGFVVMAGCLVKQGVFEMEVDLLVALELS